jgi:hypothetical protein
MNEAVAEKPGIVTSTTAAAAVWMVGGAEVTSSRDGPKVGAVLEHPQKKSASAATRSAIPGLTSGITANKSRRDRATRPQEPTGVEIAPEGRGALVLAALLREDPIHEVSSARQSSVSNWEERLVDSTAEHDTGSDAARPAPTVGGRAFLGLVKSIKRRGGDDLLTRVVHDAGPEVGAILARPIPKLSWQTYSSFVSFLEAADRTLGSADSSFARVLGVEAGKMDLGTVLKVYVALSSAERLIRSCSSVWASYYRNAGRMDAVSWDPDDTVLRIYDFDAMAPVHCRLMEGWMTSAMETLGFRVRDDAHERTCTSRGGTVHEFWCRWRRSHRLP